MRPVTCKVFGDFICMRNGGGEKYFEKSFGGVYNV